LGSISADTLTGYLVFLLFLFILYIGTSCLFALETPDRFAKSQMYVGKEAL